eukprot:scaffold1972_cov265-Chaetoceros_neogracile.AAC.18
MAISRSHSIMSAHMDSIDDAEINQPPFAASAVATQQTRTLSSDVSDDANKYALTKEPRLYDETTEEQGCTKIRDALIPEEINDMSDPNLVLRHFRADKGDITKAIKRTKYAIQWRKDFKVKEMLKAAHDPTTEKEKEIQKILMKEAETGKMFVRGYDNEGRAILYIYQKRENSNIQEHNIMHLIYQIERAIACTERMGFGKAVIVLDFDGWRMKHASSLDLTKKTIHILQDCYVERVAKVYFTNPPGVFRTFFNMVKVFLDSTTRSKIMFVTAKDRPKMETHFNPETAEGCIFGPTNLREYNVDDYFAVPLNCSFDEEL